MRLLSAACQASFADFLDMPMISAAATAEDVELVKRLSQFAVLAPELRGVAVVEFFGLVKLGVAIGVGW